MFGWWSIASLRDVSIASMPDDDLRRSSRCWRRARRRADRRRVQHRVGHPRLPRRRAHRPAQPDPARRVHAQRGRAPALLGARDARVGALLGRRAERRAPRARGAGGGRPARRRHHPERRSPAPARGQPPRRRAARRAGRGRAACAAGAASRATSCRRACSPRTPAGWTRARDIQPDGDAELRRRARSPASRWWPAPVRRRPQAGRRLLRRQRRRSGRSTAAWELFDGGRGAAGGRLVAAVYSGFRFVRRAQEQRAAGRGRQHRAHPRRRRRAAKCLRPWARFCRVSPRRWVYDRDGDERVMKLSSRMVHVSSRSRRARAARITKRGGDAAAGLSARRRHDGERGRRAGAAGPRRRDTWSQAGTTGSAEHDGQRRHDRRRRLRHAAGRRRLRQHGICSQADGAAVCCSADLDLRPRESVPGQPTYVSCETTPCTKPVGSAATRAAMKFCTKQSGFYRRAVIERITRQRLRRRVADRCRRRRRRPSPNRSCAEAAERVTRDQTLNRKCMTSPSRTT